MWPSLATANHIADVANWFFIASLVVGVVSTILIVWMAGIKEAYWEKDRTESAERVASLVNQSEELRRDTAEANAQAAKAISETAKANERTAELSQETEKLRGANLEMEKAFSPRSLAIRSQDTAALKAFGKVRWAMIILDQDEPRDTANQIAFMLNNAGWDHFTGPLPDRPGEPGFGVTIYMSDLAAQPQADALAAILRASGIDCSVHLVGRWRLKDIAPDGLQIEVGRKAPLSMERLKKRMFEEFAQERKKVLEEMQQRFPNLKPPPDFKLE
jgi:hypothetical protein